MKPAFQQKNVTSSRNSRHLRSSASPSSRPQSARFGIVIFAFVWGCVLGFLLGFALRDVVLPEANGTGSSKADVETSAAAAAAAEMLQRAATEKKATALRIELLEEQKGKLHRKISELQQVLLDESKAKAKAESDAGSNGGSANNGGAGTKTPRPRFTDRMKYMAGMARVEKRDLFERYDYGYPKSGDGGPGGGMEEALILYNARRALPSDRQTGAAAAHQATASTSSSTGADTDIPMLGAEVATENCDVLDVVTVGDEHSNPYYRHCTAIVGQYQDFHQARFMRVDAAPGKSKPVNASLPLVHVSRGKGWRNGWNDIMAPSRDNVEKNWEKLRRFLDTRRAVEEGLRPVVERVASAGGGADRKTVVVMVCNRGQASLLVNFACSSRARGHDLSNVLLFATDEETLDIAHGLGLTAVHIEENFADLPTEAHEHHGDEIMTSMMFAKLVAVHLVNNMGYDVLFQDVDVHWWKNPLDFFHDESNPAYGFDVLAQDEGSRSNRFNPFCANSGFFYVRCNDRTRYLFVSMLRSYDLVRQLRSHQRAFNILLSEHASTFGLRVKTLSGDDFPSGYDFTRRKDFMKAIVNKEREPWMFHMHWSRNANVRIKKMKQMGMWYANDQCVNGNQTATVESCCRDEAAISCFFRDMPSVIPCNDSPPEDKRSWWGDEKVA